MKFNLVLLAVFLLISSCQNEKSIVSGFEEQVKKIQHEFIPDKALDVFKAEIKRENGSWHLKGETTVDKAKNAIYLLADSLLGKNQYEKDFQSLPHPALGDSNYALVTVSVAHLKRKASHSSELIDEAIMGRTLRLHKKQGAWYLSQTDYGYVGYVHHKQIVRTTRDESKKWSDSKRVLVTALNGRIFTKQSEASTPVCDVVLNVTLRKIKSGKKWTEVSLPNGQVGFIKNDLITNFDLEYDQSMESIITTAKSMLGLPYLWGGNSSKGNDCSGYVQTVFKAHGIDLPRDARQIAEVGEKIVPDEEFSNVKAGDLLFFGPGNRITHVGISLGGDEFLHQAGNVHTSSFDPEKENYSASRKKTFKHIRRIVD